MSQKKMAEMSQPKKTGARPHRKKLLNF